MLWNRGTRGSILLESETLLFLTWSSACCSEPASRSANSFLRSLPNPLPAHLLNNGLKPLLKYKQIKCKSLKLKLAEGNSMYECDLVIQHRYYNTSHNLSSIHDKVFSVAIFDTNPHCCYTNLTFSAIYCYAKWNLQYFRYTICFPYGLPCLWAIGKGS